MPQDFFFFCCHLFSPSLLLRGCLGNIQWSRLQLGLFLAATRSWNASCLHFYVLPRRLSFPNSFFSLCLSPHPSYQVFYSHLTSFRSSPNWIFCDPIFRARPHARQWLFTGWRACSIYFVSNSIYYSFFRSLRWRFLLSWRWVSILRPSERMLSILPQDHGVLDRLMSPVSLVFHTEVTVSIGLKDKLRMGTFIP